MRNILDTDEAKVALDLHKNVPYDWYESSVKINIFQRFWHGKRFATIAPYCKRLKGKILDIGCCDGYFTHFILQKSKADSITGIDILKPAIDYARKRYQKEKRLIFQLGEAHKLPFKNASFDHIFCLEALEHIENPLVALKEMKRVIKPGGKIHILVPHENILFKVIWSVWVKTRGGIWKGTHLHDYSYDDLAGFIKKAGLNVTDSKRFMLGMLQLFIAQ